MALKVSISVMLFCIAIAKAQKIIIWTVVIVYKVYGAFYFFPFFL